jgi:hypothetical protein
MRIAPTATYTYTAHDNKKSDVLQWTSFRAMCIDADVGKGWAHITNVELKADLEGGLL